MQGKKWHGKCQSALAAAIAACLGIGAHAATLPPPPVSPAPVTDYEYDAKGNPTKVIKAKGVAGFGFTSSTAYDALDRVKTNTDARSGVTTLGFDGIDQLKQVTDPRNLVTSYQRNGLGDITQLTSPDTGTATSTYDPNGNLLTRLDSRGVLATYTYDDLNRVNSAIYTQSGQDQFETGGGDVGHPVGSCSPIVNQENIDDPGLGCTSSTAVLTRALRPRNAAPVRVASARAVQGPLDAHRQRHLAAPAAWPRTRIMHSVVSLS